MLFNWDLISYILNFQEFYQKVSNQIVGTEHHVLHVYAAIFWYFYDPVP